MKYYAIYAIDDSIIGVFNSLDEILSFLGYSKNDYYYLKKKRNLINYISRQKKRSYEHNWKYKIYCYKEE